MEYKHTTPKYVEFIRRQAEVAHEKQTPVKLSPVALLAYIEEFEEMAAEIDYLRYFHDNADFGPAHSDIVRHMQRHYRIGTGRDTPASYVYK